MNEFNSGGESITSHSILHALNLASCPIASAGLTEDGALYCFHPTTTSISFYFEGAKNYVYPLLQFHTTPALPFSFKYHSSDSVITHLCVCLCVCMSVCVYVCVGVSLQYRPPYNTGHLVIQATLSYRPPYNTCHLAIHATLQYRPPYNTGHLQPILRMPLTVRFN